MARLIASASFDGRLEISCTLIAPHSGRTILGDSRESGEVGGGASPGTPLPLVMAGLVPAIPIPRTQLCHPERDHRDKPGDDIVRASPRSAEGLCKIAHITVPSRFRPDPPAR